MKKTTMQIITAVVVALALSSAATFAATYEAKIPESVTTPDVVRTKTMGKLRFTMENYSNILR